MSRSKGLAQALHAAGPACEGCVYREWSQGYVPPQERSEARLCMVGEAPGRTEVETGVPFAGGSGGVLNGFLAEARLDRLEVAIANVVRCRPLKWDRCEVCWADWADEAGMGVLQADDGETIDCPECRGRGYVARLNTTGDYTNEAPTDGQVEECMRRYGSGWFRERGFALHVALGGRALYGLTGQGDIGSYRGSVVEGPLGKVLATYHPAFVMRSQEQRPVVQRDFSRIPAILLGHEEVRVDYNLDADGLYFTETELALDFETTGGLEPELGGIVCLSGSARPGESLVWTSEQDMRWVLAHTERAIGHYFYQYDAWWARKKGLPVPPVIIDTQVLAHLANPRIPHDLEATGTVYADPPMSHYKTKEAYATSKPAVAARDTDLAMRCFLGLRKHLEFTGQWRLAEENCIPLARIAHDMRWAGVRVDPQLMEREATRISEEVFRRGAELAQNAGIALPKKTKTGLPSPQAVKQFLYEQWDLPIQHDRKRGTITTDEKALFRLRNWCTREGRHVPLAFIKEYLDLKPMSTLAKDFRKYVEPDPITGAAVNRLHPMLNLTGTETGRLSASNPGVHQVPLEVRKAFLAEEGHVLVGADYKQLEFLVMLVRARQWDLLREGLAGKDFHKLAVSRFRKIPYDDVTKAERTAIKPINFGIIYGKGVRSTAEELDRPYEDVQADFDAFFEMLPGLKPFWRRVTDAVYSQGYWQTAWGWRLIFTRAEGEGTYHLPELYNQPIQSEAAMVTRKALIRVAREAPLMGAWPVLTVHDSIVLNVPREREREGRELLREVMSAACEEMACEPFPDGVRFPVDVTAGETWGDMK